MLLRLLWGAAFLTEKIHRLFLIEEDYGKDDNPGAKNFKSIMCLLSSLRKASEQQFLNKHSKVHCVC